MDLTPSAAGPARPFGSAFRPLLVWALISAGLLLVEAWRHTSLKVELTVDGKPLDERAVATLDGERYSRGELTQPGSKRLVISATNFEPYETNLTVWPGENDLGVIPMVRSTGTLRVVGDPQPDSVHVTGTYANRSAREAPALFPAIPVGEYEVEMRVGAVTENRRVTVERNRTNEIAFAPAVGWLTVSTEPKGATFHLRPLDSSGREWSGTVSEVPAVVYAGKYQLRVNRRDYEQEFTIEIAKGLTQRVKAAFEYGALAVTSQPAEATVMVNDRLVGKTPLELNEVRPGRARVVIRHEGYQAADVEVNIQAKTTATIATNLLSQSYVEAMKHARSLANDRNPDYPQAIALAEEALRVKPDDAEAVALKRTLEINRVAAQAKAADEKRKALSEPRRQAAEKLFRETTDPERDSGLFDTHVWSIRAAGTNVTAALKAALERAPVLWQLQSSAPSVDGMTLYRCVGKSNKARHGTVLVAELVEDETIIEAKFWDYEPGTKVNISLTDGFTRELIPVHPRHFHPEQPALAEARRKALAEDFRSKLMRELEVKP